MKYINSNSNFTRSNCANRSRFAGFGRHTAAVLLVPLTLLLASCGGGGGGSSNLTGPIVDPTESQRQGDASSDDSSSDGGSTTNPVASNPDSSTSTPDSGASTPDPAPSTPPVASNPGNTNTGTRTVTEAERTRILSDAREAIADQTATADIAVAKPLRGSVTQSSRHEVDDTEGRVTRDQLRVQLSYNDAGELQAEVFNDGTDAGWSSFEEEVESSTFTILSTYTETDSEGQRNYLSQDGSVACSTCTRYIPFFSLQDRGTDDWDDDGLVILNLFTDKLNADQTDYTAGAVWMYVPKAFASTGFADVEIGAFAEVYTDGAKAAATPRSYLTTDRGVEATYSGTGVAQAYRSAPGKPDDYSQIAVDVELTATFGDAPKVSGQIDRVRPFKDLHNINSYTTFVLQLEETDINLEGDDVGFFTGDIPEQNVDTTGTPQYAGKWGGQFYDDDAGRVAGTFAASGSSEDFGTATIAGFFHATPAEPEGGAPGE